MFFELELEFGVRVAHHSLELGFATGDRDLDVSVGVSLSDDHAVPGHGRVLDRFAVDPDAERHGRVRRRRSLDDHQRRLAVCLVAVLGVDRFRENRTRYLSPFRSRIRGTVATAVNATGREMAATNFSASTSVQTVPRRWGVVTYRFAWTGFARQDGDALVVGDVFEGGFFVAEEDTLAVSAPPSWTVRRVSPDPTDTGNGTVRWPGERDFPDNRPRVVLAPEPSDGGTATQPPPTGAGGEGGSESARGTGSRILFVLALLGAAAVLAGGGAFVYRRRRPDSPAESEPPQEEAAGLEDPITDEVRVQRLLDSNGGQMRQADIVEAVDWSKSKTSRVVSSMAEEGTVEKIRIGRENVVRLAGDG